MPERRIVASATGLVGGVVGAMLGGGTGTVVVPALDRLTDLRRPVIHGTATVANVAVAMIGTAVYALRGGAVDLMVGLTLAVGGIVGALLGARLVMRVPEVVLRVLFAVVLVLAGAKLVLDSLGVDPVGEASVLPGWVRADTLLLTIIGVAVGVVVGAWPSAMGLGGGLLAVPALILLFGVDLHVAEGTSLMVMIPNSIVGAAAHLRQGTARPRLGLRLAVAAGLGAGVGSAVALALSSRTLGLVIGPLVLLLAVREAHRLVVRHRLAGSSPPDPHAGAS